MAILDQDSFDRADESLDAGSWAERNGSDWSIVSNRATCPAGTTPSAARRTVSDYATADYKVSSPCGQNSGNPRPGVKGRAVATNGDDDYYWARIRASADAFEFGYRSAGGMTTLASGSIALDFNTDYTVRLEMEGTTIRMFVDDTQYGGDQTDSTLSAAGVGGLHLSNGDNDFGWASFLVEDFGGGAPAFDAALIEDETRLVDAAPR
jgi:hypothetical protein